MRFCMADQVSFILLAVSVLGVAHLVHSRALVVVSERIVQLELDEGPLTRDAARAAGSVTRHTVRNHTTHSAVTCI